MAKSVIVIGLGRFGTSVAHTLFQLGYDVLGIDTDEKVVQANLGHITYSVQGDATNEITLRELGVSSFDAAIVAVGSDMQSSLMISVLLAELDVPLIIGRAEDQLHGNTLQKIGVHKIIYPEHEMGEFLAHCLFNPNVLEYMDLTPNFGISKIKVTTDMADQSLRDAGLGDEDRDKHGVAVIAIRRGNNVTLGPNENDILHEDDIIIIAANDDQLERLHTTSTHHESVPEIT